MPNITMRTQNKGGMKIVADQFHWWNYYGELFIVKYKATICPADNTTPTDVQIEIVSSDPKFAYEEERKSCIDAIAEELGETVMVGGAYA